jgi:hypothetical protein
MSPGGVQALGEQIAQMTLALLGSALQKGGNVYLRSLR